MLCRCFTKHAVDRLLLTRTLAPFPLGRLGLFCVNESQSVLQMGMWVRAEHGGIATCSIFHPPLLPSTKPRNSSMFPPVNQLQPLAPARP